MKMINKSLVLVLATLLQAGCIHGQIESPANLNIGNVIKAVQNIGSVFSGNTSALAGVLGLNPADPLAAVTRLMEFRTEYNIGSECLEHMMAFIQAVPQGEEWAMSMVDAFGKPPGGVMQGKIKWIGDFDECTSVKAVTYKNATIKSSPRDLFKGMYCNLDYGVKAPIPFSLGLCLPDTCTTADLKSLAALVANLTAPFLKANLGFTLPAAAAATTACQEELPLDTRAIIILVVCSLFALVMVVATLYDVIYIQWHSEKQSKQTKKTVYAQQNDTFKPDSNTQNGGHTSIDQHPEKGVINDVTNGAITSVPESVPEMQITNNREPGTAAKLLLSFSMYTNATKILNTSQPKGALTAVNGIRFLSMSWVIVGHTYTFAQPFEENQMQFFPDYATRFLFQPIVNGTFSVDSFFVLSGLLLTYLTLKELKKRRESTTRVMSTAKFWGLFYFHRIWRLTPPYMLTLMVYVSLNKYWGNGPMWPQKGMEINDCTSWWTNLLYINNLVDTKQQCFGWAWYLANDMQFYVLSPLMIVPLFLFPVVGGVMCLAFLLVSVISSAMISVKYDLPPNFFFDQSKIEPYMFEYYFKPWCRVGPYAVGVFVGYILYRHFNAKSKIPKVTLHANSLGAMVQGCSDFNTMAYCQHGRLVIYDLYMVDLVIPNKVYPDQTALLLILTQWFIASTAGALVIYGLYTDDLVNPLSETMSHAYNATSRGIWGACVAWLVFACATGIGGPVNHILSWPGFVPLGRLSYCAYLVHPFLMYIHDQSMRTLIHASDYSMVYLVLGHLCISYGAAFVVSLAFEAPMMSLEKVLLGRAKRS